MSRFYNLVLVLHVSSLSLSLIQVKREELLQYAQSAIAGLKVHADLARLVCNFSHGRTIYLTSGIMCHNDHSLSKSGKNCFKEYSYGS